MTDEKYSLLETTDDHPEEIVAFSKRFCADPCADVVLESLRGRGMDDREIAIAFLHIARIPGRWEQEREPEGQAAKRRTKLAEKLGKLAVEVENDPDLSGLFFGINTISYGSADGASEGLTSLANCMREGMEELERQSPLIKAAANNKAVDQKSVSERTILLKKFAIRKIFALIDKSEQRAPNIETAALTSILLGGSVTANDVTQARKSERRKYDYD